MESKKFKPINHSIAFRALFFWGKCLGLNSVSLTKSNEVEFSYIGLLYGCILCAIHTFVFYRAMTARVKLVIPSQTPIAIIVNYLGMFWQYFDTVLTWFAFAVYQNRIKSIVDCFVGLENTSIKLGIPENYSKYFREFGSSIMISNILFLASLTLSGIMLRYYRAFDPFLWTNFIVPQIVGFNMQIFFMWILKLVKKKFHRLNEKVKILMENDCIEGSEDHMEAPLTLLSNFCRNSNLMAHKINIVSQLHRELRDALNHIEKHFAVIQLFAILDSFIYTSLDIYDMYSYLKSIEKPFKGTNFIHLGLMCHWIITDIALLIGIFNICSATINEANNTGNIIHSIINNRQILDDNHEAANLYILSLDLLQNRVNISLLGLLYVDNWFIYKTMATVTTFVTIMLQFYH